ncbi:MAG: DUF1565 domain-containing protein, partial [Asticcacaulis sp.]
MPTVFTRRLTLALMTATALMSAPSALLAAQGTTYYVAPNGNDKADGSAQKPFKSLTRAQEAVRKSNKTGDVSVVIADGTYALEKPLIFTQADGGQNGYSVTWQAAEGAKPLLSGGLTVTGFTLVDEKERVYVANTPKGLDTRQLWVNDTLA